MDWPTIVIPPTQIVISTYSHLAGVNFGAPASGAPFVNNNEGYFYPFRLTEALLVQELFVINGATASGNLDVGIYDAAGTRLVSSGAVAQSGTNTPQEFDVTDTQLGPGTFYFGISASLTTATAFRSPNTGIYLRMLGCFSVATSHPLPATVSINGGGTNASSLVLMGLLGRTFI